MPLRLLEDGVLKTYRPSSAVAERRFCPNCGSHVCFAHDSEPHLLDVAIGSLDQPDLAPPAHHVFGDTRIAWLDLDSHLPKRLTTVVQASTQQMSAICG